MARGSPSPADALAGPGPPRSAALVQYEKCRQILIEELGVEPAAKTAALYERIRDGALAPSSERLEMTISERGEGADQQVRAVK